MSQTVQFIGMKDFRRNLAQITKKAKNDNVKFIVLKKNIPMLEISAINEKEFAISQLLNEINEAREQIQNGEYFTHEEVLKELGLN